MVNKVLSPWASPARPNRKKRTDVRLFPPEGVTHSLIGSFCRAGLLCLFLALSFGLTHCSSDDNGGGGGGSTDPTDPELVYTLYMVGGTNDVLYSVDTSTGEASPVGSCYRWFRRI